MDRSQPWADGLVMPLPHLGFRRFPVGSPGWNEWTQARNNQKARLAEAITILVDAKLRSDSRASSREFSKSNRFWIAKQIWRAANVYLAYIDLARGAPRRADVEEKLSHLAEACKAAADAIDALDDETLAWWHGHGPDPDRVMVRFDDGLARLYDRALGEGLPPRVGFDYPDLDDQEEPEERILLAPQLRMTAQRAALLREWVREDASEAALDAIDALSKETVALWHGHGLDPDKTIIKFDDALKRLHDRASRKGISPSVNIE